jgi:hypothetical protein
MERFWLCQVDAEKALASYILLWKDPDGIDEGYAAVLGDVRRKIALPSYKMSVLQVKAREVGLARRQWLIVLAI